MSHPLLSQATPPHHPHSAIAPYLNLAQETPHCHRSPLLSPHDSGSEAQGRSTLYAQQQPLTSGLSLSLATVQHLTPQSPPPQASSPPSLHLLLSRILPHLSLRFRRAIVHWSPRHQNLDQSFLFRISAFSFHHWCIFVPALMWVVVCISACVVYINGIVFS